MDRIDEIIKAKAKMETIVLHEGFEERNDKLIKELGTRSVRFISKWPVRFAIAFSIIMLTGTAAAAAYTLSGGDFFKQFFADLANKDASNYSYMNTEQLEDMASSTVGTVVDTDELTIDVMGVIISGNTVEIVLRVTANQLDSVIYETGIEPLENYRFHDDMSGSLFEDLGVGSTGYRYSDKDKSLAPNQFKILYAIAGSGDFKKDQYTIKITDFGYFDFSREDQFQPLYSGSWQFNIAIDPKADTSKSIIADKEIMVSDYSFTLASINITPLACTLRLSCNEDKANINKHIKEIYEAFSDRSQACSLTLADGTTLNNRQFEAIPFGGADGFTLTLKFKGPVTVDNVVSLSLFGTDYSLK
jgi:hypothetical protein